MFVKIYDALMADVDYELLFESIKPYIKPNDFIIDAGCGTGYFLEVLLKKGYDAIGIDHDAEMLKYAKDRLIQAQCPSPLFEHDLRNPMHVSCDVVISLFDVMNYFKGVKQVFKHIYQALNEDGKFIFDIYNDQVMKSYDGYIEQEDDPLHYHWQITVKNQSLKHIITANDQTWIIRQTMKPLDDYISSLRDVGFKDIKILESIDIRKHLIIAYK